MKPTVTITLEEYNRLLKSEEVIEERKAYVINHSFGSFVSFTRFYVTEESKVLNELQTENDRLKKELDELKNRNIFQRLFS